MANGEDNTFDIKGNAQKYGPKSANKLMLFVNQKKISSDNKPSLVGYMTDKDMNLSSVSLWKGKTKKGRQGYAKIADWVKVSVKKGVPDM